MPAVFQLVLVSQEKHFVLDETIRTSPKRFPTHA